MSDNERVNRQSIQVATPLFNDRYSMHIALMLVQVKVLVEDAPTVCNIAVEAHLSGHTKHCAMLRALVSIKTSLVVKHFAAVRVLTRKSAGNAHL